MHDPGEPDLNGWPRLTPTYCKGNLLDTGWAFSGNCPRAVRPPALTEPAFFHLLARPPIRAAHRPRKKSALKAWSYNLTARQVNQLGPTSRPRSIQPAILLENRGVKRELAIIVEFCFCRPRRLNTEVILVCGFRALVYCRFSSRPRGAEKKKA